MSRFALLCFAGLALAPATAFADDDVDPQAPFERGRLLVKDGLYAEALLEFEKSFAIRPTSGAMLNMADCYEKLGRYASASTAFERASVLAQEAGQTERAREASERKEAVEPLVSTLTVHPGTREVRISIDGQPAARDDATRIDGGEHVVRVEAPCTASAEIHVTIGVRSDRHEMTANPGPSTCESAPPSPPVESSSSWTTQRTVAVAVGGAGLVSLGVGLGFGLSATSYKDSLDAACRDYPRGCPADRRDELDRTAASADRAATISTVFTVSGIVLVGVATVLYLTGRSDAVTRGRRATATPMRSR